MSARGIKAAREADRGPTCRSFRTTRRRRHRGSGERPRDELAIKLIEHFSHAVSHGVFDTGREERKYRCIPFSRRKNLQGRLCEPARRKGKFAFLGGRKRERERQKCTTSTQCSRGAQENTACSRRKSHCPSLHRTLPFRARERKDALRSEERLLLPCICRALFGCQK